MMILSAWFDHLEETFYCEKKFSSKTLAWLCKPVALLLKILIKTLKQEALCSHLEIVDHEEEFKNAFDKLLQLNFFHPMSKL